MICNEPGVRPPSEYFFFSSSEDFLRYNYGIVNCGHFFCYPGYRKERNGNAFPLLLYIEHGEFHLKIQKNLYTAVSEDIILIDCSQPHSYYVTTDCEFYYFHFTGRDAFQVTSHFIHKNKGPIFRLTHPSAIRYPMQHLISRLSFDPSVTDVELSCLAYQCLCTLHAADDAFTTETRENHSLVNLTALYVRNHIHRFPTLEELASHASLSPYYFAHLFKTEAGISPIEYVAVTKINYAKNILKTTSASIREIAEILGYSSDASFVNAFKKRAGISPARFRKELLSISK